MSLNIVLALLPLPVLFNVYLSAVHANSALPLFWKHAKPMDYFHGLYEGSQSAPSTNASITVIIFIIVIII